MSDDVTVQLAAPALAPHSQEAEESVLGGILINFEAFYEVMGFLTPESFFILRNNWVFEAMTRLHKRGEVIEYLNVIEELRDQGRLEHMGGAAYITYLASMIGTSIYTESHGRKVEQHYIRRKLIDAAMEIAGYAKNTDMEIKEVVAKSEAACMQAAELRGSQELTGADDALQELVGEIQELRDGLIEPNALKTYTSLDNHLTGGGMEPGAVIVSSDTSGGKSLYMINLMLNQARQGHKVAMFTMEMRKKAVLRRMLARLSSVPTDCLAKGIIPPDKESQYQDAVTKLALVVDNLLIDDTKVISVFEIISKIRRAVRREGIVAAYVDYAGLIDDMGLDEERRDKVVGKFIRLLQSLATTVNIPIIIGAQQNRQGGGIKSVGESYEIAQHCDGFLFISDADENPDQKSVVRYKKITIEKQRDGKRGVSVEMIFNLATQDAYEVMK